MPTQAEKVAQFQRLHEADGAFLIPNPWDIGSAVRLQSLGYPALATTSSGFAFTLGRMDMQVTLDEKIEHCRQLAASTTVPVNADLEKGFADEPDGVADCIRRAAATGLAGASIEDATGDKAKPIYDFSYAVERIAAAAEAAHSAEVPIMLTARAENLLWGVDDLDDTIKRLQAFAEAGADVLYAPALKTIEQVAEVVSSVSKPVNVLAPMVAGASVEALSAAGAKRLSVGGALARAAIAGELNAAREMLERGTFSWTKEAEPGGVLAGLMGGK